MNLSQPIDNSGRQIRNILIGFAAILILYILKMTANIMIPLVIALFIFIVVNPVLSRLDKMRIPSFLSMLITLILVVAVFFLFVYIFFVMVNMLLQTDTGLPAYAVRVQQLDRQLSAFIAPYLDEDPVTFSILAYLDINWYGVAMSSLTSISSKFISIISDAMLVLLYLLFMILERQTILPKLMAALPRGKVQRVSQMIARMNRQTAKYTFLKLIISVITGILFYFAAVITGLDFALVWGVLAVILNFIPTIGSIVCTAGTIVMALIQFAPDWSNVVYVTVLMIGIEMVVGNIIDPKLQGVQLNISPLVILVALAVWGYIWGLAGMFLAVPLTSIIQIVCANIPTLRPIAILLSEGRYYRRDFDKKRKKRNAPVHEADDIELPDEMGQDR